MVLRVLVLYIPLPMFWALFDQQVHEDLSVVAICRMICVLFCKITKPDRCAGRGGRNIQQHLLPIRDNRCR